MKNFTLGLQRRSFNLKSILTTLLVISILPLFTIPTHASQFGTNETGTVTMTVYNHNNSDGEINLMADHNNEGTSSFFEENEFALQIGSWYFEGKYGFSGTANLEKDVNNIAPFSPANPVPEPATMILLGLGLFMVASVAKRKLNLNY